MLLALQGAFPRFSCFFKQKKQIYSFPDGSELLGSPTFHCHWYSSTVGGFFSILGLDSDSPIFHALFPFSASFVGGSQNSFVTGNPVLSYRNFKVKRGPISCNAAFFTDMKAYLGARESADRYKL